MLPTRRLRLPSFLPLVLLAGCTGAGGATVSAPTPGPAGELVVEISNFAFKPESVTLAVGQSVRFVNKDFMAHTVTPLDAAAFPAEDDIRPGQERLVTPKRAGSWAFRCDYHPSMKGGLTVTGDAAPAASPTQAPLQTPTPQPTAMPSPAGSVTLSPAIPPPSPSPSPTPIPTDFVEVKISAFAFVPATILARPGQTLRFTNVHTGVPHTVTSVVTGSEARVFDSARLETGQTYTVSVPATGSYPIVCNFHPSMTATVRVE
ncbi:MAG: cupredoxin domain-containing protein [Candidatus Sericytochromatia bacterium]|nr:cupredoxin domain-containing protein [Candidatus Sericytochromatia bacterium]